MGKTTAAEAAGGSDTAPDATAAPAPAPGAGEASSAAGAVLTEEALVAAVRRAVRNWSSEHFHNSPVSRATSALNYLTQTAVPDLEAKILKEIH